MDPTNYIFGGPNPYQMAMQGFQGGLDAGAQSAGIQQEDARLKLATQAQQDNQANQTAQLGMDQSRLGMQQQQFGQQQAELSKQQAARAGLAALMAPGVVLTTEKIAEFLAAHPEISSEASAAFSAHSTAKQESYMKFGAQVYSAIQNGNIDLAKSMIKEHQTAAENSGDQQEADQAKGLLMQIEMSPDNAGRTLRIFADAATNSGFSKMVDAAAGVSPTASVQSSSTYTDGTSVIIFNDGTKRVTDGAGQVLEGQAAIDAIAAGNRAEAAKRLDNAVSSRTGTLSADINLGGEVQAIKAAADAQIKMATDAITSVSKIRNGIANIDVAINALDQGAPSGIIMQYLPAITDAAVELNNAKNRLGLDVVGSVTFGALSEGEMKLAMDTAIPMGMTPLALKDWLARKVTAQKKLADYLDKEAAYLIDPQNTIKGWLASNGNGSYQPTATPATQKTQAPIAQAPAPTAQAPTAQAPTAQAPTAPAQAEQATAFKKRADLSPQNQVIFDQIIARNSGKPTDQWDKSDVIMLRNWGMIQ